MKHCRKCGLHKADVDFYFDKRRNTLAAPCKKCRIACANQDWKIDNPEKARASSRKSKLKAKYGLSPATLTDLWNKQNGCCAICNRPISLNAKEKASKPHIDHCHVSEIKVVRGLLCLTCNTGLGMFGDSVDLLDAAKAYLLLSRVAITVNSPSVTASVSADIQSNLTIH